MQPFDMKVLVEKFANLTLFEILSKFCSNLFSILEADMLIGFLRMGRHSSYGHLLSR